MTPRLCRTGIAPAFLTVTCLTLGLALPQAGHAAPDQTAAPAKTDVVAREGGTTITVADVDRMLADLDPQVRARVLAAPGGVLDLVRNRLARQSLLAEADSKNWGSRPEIAAQIAAARDGVVAQSYLASVSAPDPNYPSDADVQAAYDANKSQFAIPKQVHLSEVLIPGASNTPPKKSPSALYGSGTPNDLGLIVEDRLAPPLHDAVVNLPVGGFTPALRIQDGWHVFKVLGITEAGTAPLAQVRPQIVDALRHQQGEAKARSYMQNLQAKQHPVINEIALAAIGK